MIEDGAIAIADGALAWLGPQSDSPREIGAVTRSLAGQWVTPALIDCHTHLVFGGDRSAEFEQRLQGASYEDIARSGGGILSTVRATREAAPDALFESAMRRVRMLEADGVATVEIKSGYGLDIDSEIKMLEVARRIGTSSNLTVRTTLLAAHTVPPEFNDEADAYVDLICDELLPLVAETKLADAVDAYCETIAFSADQVAKVFRCAQSLGIPVKLAR